MEGTERKTSWEWLELLVIPLLLAGGVFYLESRVEKRQQSIASDRQKQSTLTNYLDRMQVLLLEKKLYASSEDSAAQGIARALTEITISELDSERNQLLIIFLQRSDMLNGGNSLVEEQPDRQPRLLAGLSLSHADLHGANLTSANLRYADLSGADLRNVNLTSANLRSTNLSYADLSGADLSTADLAGASLYGANLRGADMEGADLSAANLRHTDLRGAELTWSNMTDASICKTRFPRHMDLDPDRDCLSPGF